ncbi:trafficking protein particle complex subunit 8 [Sitophilus oryzae]|uniref:Trafficking protein particle complex subunit 8 n=1 Tax=Sitophilus oryzae TaxID=7048 RepID=A0A6J2XXJ9_SITOR|nr:trafficking protein particle complex subunit 8 [Sitophilus oryzae]
MSQCKQSPQEFIKDVFTPQIAVLCTSSAEKCCEKNNLDFTELLQPFSKLTNDATYKDVNGTTMVVKNLKVSFLDVNLRPPQTTLARKLLNSSVSEAPEPKIKVHEAKEYKLEVPLSTPWFETWRDTFMKVQYPSDHEFTKHYLACLMVVSSSDNNPIDAIAQLLQKLNQIQLNSSTGKLPKWFSANTLKYYVIIHDNVDGKLTLASETFECMKKTYGIANCFLLRMNSRPPGSADNEHLADPWSQFLNVKIDAKNYQVTPEYSPGPDRHQSLEIGQEANEKKSLNYHPLSPEVDDLMVDFDIDKDESIQKRNKSFTHGCCLSVDDIEQIKSMVYEFTSSCLLPYIEKQLALLYDSISNKKGMSKSLFSATKRWFSTNKPGASSIAINNSIYATDAPELQIRRLADLYFMFGNYSAAFQAYHSAKRDYNADQAWLYYAGALEMAALSAFMANESSKKTLSYMEESITTYLNPCKMTQFATRATILSSECLKHEQLYGEAAHQLIRMTSEDSDLRSALLLEQASYCFMLSSMLRKYAFHMVLAGHRFSKAAQKKHSLRCYKQAYQIYENTGWDLAADHIHYTIGRQANNLQKFNEAVESFAKLLIGESKQNAQQQGVFLKEYLTILDSKLQKDNSEDTPVLPVPDLTNTSVKVLVGPTRPLSTPGQVPALGISFSSCEDPSVESRWQKLEEMIVSEVNGVAPLIFKPMITLYTNSTLEKNTPVAIINEPIQVSIELYNTLQTVVLLKDIYLLWSYENETEVIFNKVLTEDVDQYIKTFITKSVIIQGNCKQDLVLSLTPLVTGNVTISAVCYTLSGSTASTESIFVKGKKLINISSNSDAIKPICIKIVPFAPCLQMTFSDLNLEFLAGELQRVSVTLQNTGSVPLKNVLLATSVPLSVDSELKVDPKEYTYQDAENVQVREKLARKNHITTLPLPNNRLDNGHSISFHLWLRAPANKGPTSIDLLTYYENIDSASIPKYRLIRHSWNLSVQESISIDVSPQTSYNSISEEELALALKATNLNNIHNSISTEITLLKVCLLSNKWFLTKDMVTPKYINLNSQESAHILIKAKRRVCKDSQYSFIPLHTDKISAPHLSTALLSFARKTDKALLNVFEVNHDVRKLKDCTLVLEWKALVCDASNRRVINGQTCVPIKVYRNEQIQFEKLISDSLIELSSSVENTDKKEFSQNQVFYNLLHTPLVKHNFTRTKTCVVPVTLVLHSLVSHVIEVTVNTIEKRSKPVSNKTIKTNLFIPQATGNFCWLVNGKILRTLDPLTTTTVQLSVIVTSPGTFDLGANLGVFCNSLDKDEDPVLQLCEIHSALIVLDSNS